MPDALLTLNAGSSSLKFSIFRDGDPPLLIFRGQFEELMTRPRFSVRDAASNVVREQEWKATTVDRKSVV